MGLGFAIGMTVMNYFTGDAFSLFKFLLYAIFFGGFMTIMYVPGYVTTLKKLGITEFSKENVGVRQQRSIVSAMRKDELMTQIQASPDLKRMKVEEGDDEVRLISKFSADGWGEEVKIRIRLLQDGLNSFDIVSRPRSRVAMFDGGRNLKHVIQIETLIKQFS